MNLLPFLRALASSLLILSSLSAKSLLPAESIPLDSMAAFTTKGDNWQIASALAGDPRREITLEPIAGTGIIVNTAPKTTGKHLLSAWEHADLELSFEYLMPRESNSGVYLMGRYEIQLLDSWGVTDPTVRDAGAVYERWNRDTKSGYEGKPPAVNATRAPGLWQTMRIVFRAPRFNAAGEKTANARFVEVEHNGFLIHEDVEVTGPTRAAMFGDEKAMGPLMIQGDHGPVAFRNFTRKTLDFSTIISLENVQSELQADANEDDSSFAAPVTADSIDPSQLGEARNFKVRYTGELTVPVTGTYAFDANVGGTTSLQVNEQDVLIPINPGVRSVPLHLEKGTHEFELNYAQGNWGKPAIALFIEGPGIARHQLETAAAQTSHLAEVETLTAAMADEEEPVAEAEPTKEEQYITNPSAERVRVQRGFTPFDPLKRLYSIAVGDPGGVHYAYDFDTATVLRVWNGPFLGLEEFWDGRAHNQYLKPIGPSLTFHDHPTIALLERGDHDWPTESDAMWQSKGYTLNERGEPTFFSQLSELHIEDRLITQAAPRTLQRTLTLSGDHTSWMTGILLAEAETITASAAGLSYVIGDRHYYLDVAADNPHPPFIRHINGRDQLILYVPKWEEEVTLSYNLVW